MRLNRRDLLKGGLVTGTALLLPGAAGRAAAAGLPSLRRAGPAAVGPFLALAGSLHDHSTDSDGDSSSEAISTWVAAHRQELGIDYAIFSDHSDFFPVSPLRSAADQAVDPSPSWIRQVGLDRDRSAADFAYLRAFEWTNDQENHLNVLFTANWTSRAVTGDASLVMTDFWEWFDTSPAAADPTGAGVVFGGSDGIGQFNHPGDKGALNWDDYAPDAGASARMGTIEVHGDQGKGGRGSSDAGWYWFALAQGWHVAPVMNWDYHVWSSSGVLANQTPGSDYGVGGHLPGQRSVVFGTGANVAAIRSALEARRTCASEIPDAWAVLRGPGGEWMGGTIAAAPGQTLRLSVEAESPTEALRSVDIVGSGVSPYPYYYGDNFVNGNPQIPVGTVDVPTGGQYSQLLPGYTKQHARYVASGGHATRKANIDTPPPGATLATASFPGTAARQTVTVDVTVPSTPSPRPDGLHFLYAVVSTGPAATPARMWTAPLLVTPAVAPALPEVDRALLLPAAGLATIGAVAYAARHRADRDRGDPAAG